MKRRELRAMMINGSVELLRGGFAKDPSQYLCSGVIFIGASERGRGSDQDSGLKGDECRTDVRAK